MDNYIEGNTTLNATTLKFYGFSIMFLLVIIFIPNKIIESYHYYGIESPQFLNFVLMIVGTGILFMFALLSYSNENHYFTFAEDKIIIESAILKNRKHLDYDKIKYITILNKQFEILIKIDYITKNKVKKYHISSTNLSHQDIIKFQTNCHSRKINYHYNANSYGL